MAKIIEHDLGLVTTRGVIRDGMPTTIIKGELPRADNMPMCPIRKGQGVKCRTSCAMYQDGGCVLASMPGSGDSLGKNCPLTNCRCAETCALFNCGCALIAIAQLGRKDT